MFNPDTLQYAVNINMFYFNTQRRNLEIWRPRETNNFALHREGSEYKRINI